ncbi:hypothetical protein PQY88_02985 [Gammaproteobacteria bacterium]|nr:hypothetical protein [Gammaproteobacteria bacterium]
MFLVIIFLKHTINNNFFKNKELWQKLDELINFHQVQWHWVKGHSGDAGNEMADLLANQGIDSIL